MKIFDLDIRQGEKKKCVVTIQDNYQIPVWIVCGKEEGNTLVLTAGVHGCEYIGIQAAKQLFNQINPDTLKGCMILFPLLNQQGFYGGHKQIMPEDGKNLNRVFPGSLQGSQSEQIAYWIEKEVYPVADFIIDLHGGDINEDMTPLVFFPIDAARWVKEKAKNAAMHMPVAYRIPSTAKNGLYSYAVQKGVPALLLEVGGSGLWNKQQVKLCVECVQGVMGYLNMGISADLYIDQRESTLTIYEEAEMDGFWYPDVRAGGEVKKGQVIGVLKDINDTVIASYLAAVDGVVLYYTQALGIQKGDSLVAYCEVQ